MRERSNPWLSYSLHCWGLLRRKIPEYPYENTRISVWKQRKVSNNRHTCVHCKLPTLVLYSLQVWHKEKLFEFFFFFFFFFNTNLQVCRSVGRAGLNFLANLRRVTLSATAAAVPLSSHTYVIVCSPPIPNSAVWSLVHLSVFLTLHTWWNIRFSFVPQDLVVF